MIELAVHVWAWFVGHLSASVDAMVEHPTSAAIVLALLISAVGWSGGGISHLLARVRKTP